MIDFDNDPINTKYCILMMMHADMDKKEGTDTQEAKSMEEIWYVVVVSFRISCVGFLATKIACLYLKEKENDVLVSDQFW